MSARPLRLARLEDKYVFAYLNGRPFDERVTYATYVNVGKKYPYASERQNTRERRYRFKGLHGIQAVTQ
jgi:hypothetical protein